DLGLGVDAGPEPPDDLPVNLNPARADQLLAVPPAAHARGGEDLLQPDAAGDVGEAVALALVGGEVVVTLEAHAAQRAEPGLRLRGEFRDPLLLVALCVSGAATPACVHFPRCPRCSRAGTAPAPAARPGTPSPGAQGSNRWCGTGSRRPPGRSPSPRRARAARAS